MRTQQAQDSGDTDSLMHEDMHSDNLSHTSHSERALDFSPVDNPYPQATTRYPAQIIVDLAAIRNNVRSLRERNNNAQVLTVIKANGYGHGFLPTALAALAGGSTWFGAAQPHDLLILREAGIGADRAHMITWMWTATEDLAAIARADIDFSVSTLSQIRQLAQLAHEIGQRVRIHVACDTGFGRNGFTPQALPEALDLLKKLASTDPANEVADKPLLLVGQFSHLAVADAPDDPLSVASTDEQINTYQWFSEQLDQAGLTPSVRHLANTAASLTRPEISLDMVRPGIGIYGYSADPAMGLGLAYGLKPALRLQAQLATVRTLPADHAIGYGRTYITQHESLLAIVPVGYSDGIPRSASGFNEQGWQHTEHQGGPVLLGTVRLRNGSEASVIAHVAGRVCMDQFMLALSAETVEIRDHSGNLVELSASDYQSLISQIREGDTVLLFGPGRGSEYGEPNLEEWAASANTITYEILTRLGSRFPRIYENAREVLSEADLAMLEHAGIALGK